jgi:hypothetical protein
MGDKKGKALVMKLLDDLLNEDGEVTANDQIKNTDTTRKASGKPQADQPEDLDISGTEKSIKDESIMDLYQKESEPSPQVKGKSDDTVKINETKLTKASRPPPEPTEAKSTVGRFAPLRSGGFSSATEAALATSENLRIAQTRILELEQELSRLRTNNEQLAAAGETLRRRADELLAQTTTLQGRLERTAETKDQEIEILRQSQSQRDKDSSALKLKIEEMEMRLSTNIQKIRVRERELENRLELVKMESTALVRNKDEIILDLKRQVDQLNLELENYRNKGQELNKQLGDKQEILRRTVKALRLALSMLEGDEEAGPQKKVK